MCAEIFMNSCRIQVFTEKVFMDITCPSLPTPCDLTLLHRETLQHTKDMRF